MELLKVYPPISRACLQQENRAMRFTDTYDSWQEGRLTQSEAALILGMSERNFRRHIDRYEADGLPGLLYKRLSQTSHRKAAAGEITQVAQLHKSSFAGWNITHFHRKYTSQFKGQRSYSWLKSVLQGAGVVKLAKNRGKHRIKRERMPLPGMMLHQDASTHRWVADQAWDLVVTLDDAANEHTSVFFCDQEGTDSSFHGIGQTIERYGLFVSLYTDRCAHYFTTAVAGGKVDKISVTQVGRALKQLRIDHIAAYSSQARGRGEWAFKLIKADCPRSLP
jgi:transposase